MRYSITVPDELDARIVDECMITGEKKNGWIVDAIARKLVQCASSTGEDAPGSAPNPAEVAPDREIEQLRDRLRESDETRRAVEVQEALTRKDLERSNGEIARLEEIIHGKDERIADMRGYVVSLEGQIASITTTLNRTLPPPVDDSSADQGAPSSRPWWKFWGT